MSVTYHIWFESQPYPDAVPFTSFEACAKEIARQQNEHPVLREEIVEVVAINGSWPHYEIVRAEMNRLGRLALVAEAL